MLAHVIGLYGFVMLGLGLRALVSPAFGIQLFGDWSTPKKDLMRVVVTGVVLTASWVLTSDLIRFAGSIFGIAAIFYAVMGRWQKGHRIVQGFLVESRVGTCLYVLCVIMPMAVCLIAGAYKAI